MYAPDEVNLSPQEIRDYFLQGRCALTIDFPDLAALSTGSTVFSRGKVGVARTPGSVDVFVKGEGITRCSVDLCLFLEDDTNYAPFSPFGGWFAGVSKASSTNVKPSLLPLALSGSCCAPMLSILDLSWTSSLVIPVCICVCVCLCCLISACPSLCLLVTACLSI